MARSALSAVFFAVALSAPTADAEQARRDVHLNIEDCSPSALDLRDAYAAAELELGLDTAHGAEPRAGAVELEAVLLCDRGVKARLTLRTADSTAARTISLDDTHVKDRARALALALAELVRAEWRWVTTGENGGEPLPPDDERKRNTRASERAESERVEAPAPSEPKPATRASPSEARAPTAPDSEQWLSFEALGRARMLFPGPSFLYGASALLRARRWSLAAEALFGRAEAELGTARLGYTAARLGFDLVRSTPGRLRLGVEPGVAAGVTWLSGEPARAAVEVESTTAFFADARLALRGELRSPFMSPTLSLEGGYAAGLAATEHASTIGVTGGWFLGAALGVALPGDRP